MLEITIQQNLQTKLTLKTMKVRVRSMNKTTANNNTFFWWPATENRG